MLAEGRRVEALIRACVARLPPHLIALPSRDAVMPSPFCFSPASAISHAMSPVFPFFLLTDMAPYAHARHM
jgi:hypothetical protein